MHRGRVGTSDELVLSGAATTYVYVTLHHEHVEPNPKVAWRSTVLSLQCRNTNLLARDELIAFELCQVGVTLAIDERCIIIGLEACGYCRSR